MGKKDNEYSDSLRRIKSQLLVSEVQKRRDVHSLAAITRSKAHLDWSNRSNLMIESNAWLYVTKILKCDPKLVFCHPQLLVESPSTSFYYRGLCGLSIKAAKEYFGSIESLEKGTARTRLDDDKALRMAQTYNTFVSSIVANTTDWTLENGARTIIATLGITLDGVMRNKVGEIAEDRVRLMLVQWLRSKRLILHPTLGTDIQAEQLPNRFQLKNGIIMQFSSEPDISFELGNELVAIIEIKGGIDPAGALERYGAARKSFEHAMNRSPRCKTFYLGGVFTPELEKRMSADRFVEKHYNIIRILQDKTTREDFLRELFHHTLRVN